MATPPVTQSVRGYAPDYQLAANTPKEEQGFFSRSLQAVEDAALGVGQVFSTASGYLLPGYRTPIAAKILSGSFRAAGGLVTAATSGYRIVKTYQREREEGSSNFHETTKELVVTAGSVTAGLGVGTLGGAAASVAAFLGAPALIVGGVTAAGVFGAGYAAYAARDYLSSWYDSL